MNRGFLNIDLQLQTNYDARDNSSFTSSNVASYWIMLTGSSNSWKKVTRATNCYSALVGHPEVG
jgi:hypothetical protein